jgi:hypothetical protein
MVMEVIAVTMVAPLQFFFFQQKRDSSVTKKLGTEFDCRQGLILFNRRVETGSGVYTASFETSIGVEERHFLGCGAV